MVERPLAEVRQSTDRQRAAQTFSSQMHLLYNGKRIELPMDQPLVLGRNQLLEITDERISRRQVSVYYDATLDEFQVCVLGSSANVTLNGSPLKPQEPKPINDQDKLCLYKDSYCVKFIMDSESVAMPNETDLADSSDQNMSEISEESSDIYDFEKGRL